MPPAKIIAILQPVYLPWLGYFEQMAMADRFIFMDDVQYTRRDWRNRNRIKTSSDSIWLTVPVKKHPRHAQIRDIEINYQQDWRRRHLRSIEVSYCKCPHFEPLFSELKRELEAAPTQLLALNCRLTRLLCPYFDISTPTSFSSEVPRAEEDHGGEHDKNQRIIDICRHFGADLLYDGAKAADFIDIDRFRQSGIEVVFQNYQHPTYQQAFGEFLTHQSAIDLVMNTGPEAPAILRSSPRPESLRRRQASI